MDSPIDIFLHLDSYLPKLLDAFGGWLYVVLFLIIFCETGLVVTPFLPGDSLLFAVGAVAALDGSSLSLGLLIGLLITAAVAGDAVNYAIGAYAGPRVFRSDHSFLFNKKHLLKTQYFYQKYGGKTIIIARFIPIIRTFAPFVAGIGKMRYRRFGAYNIVGGVVWVMTFLVGGYLLGEIPTVKRNFQVIIIAIIIISILPAVIEVVLTRRRRGEPAPLTVESEQTV